MPLQLWLTQFSFDQLWLDHEEPSHADCGQATTAQVLEVQDDPHQQLPLQVLPFHTPPFHAVWALLAAAQVVAFQPAPKMSF